MKNNAGPAAIATAVIGLLLVIFVIYHYAMRGNPGQKEITPDNRPEYVKKLQQGVRTDYYGNTMPAQGGTGR
jgi:hypothetical protein